MRLAQVISVQKVGLNSHRGCGSLEYFWISGVRQNPKNCVRSLAADVYSWVGT